MSEPGSFRIGVVGAGVMGAGIAQVMAIAGYDVVSRDIDPTVLESAREEVAAGRFGLKGAVERGKMSEADADAALARIAFTTDLDEVVATDLVLEAVPERLELKIGLFRDLDRRCEERVVLASNSSGFPIEAIGAATDRPDRVVGWHWASPAPVMKLAEIVRGPETSDETIDLVVALANRAGKNPVVIGDTTRAWGYVANRVYSAMVREALKVVDEGIATHEQVDQLMTDCFRWPTGPFGMARGATSGWKQEQG